MRVPHIPTPCYPLTHSPTTYSCIYFCISGFPWNVAKHITLLSVNAQVGLSAEPRLGTWHQVSKYVSKDGAPSLLCCPSSWEITLKLSRFGGGDPPSELTCTLSSHFHNLFRSCLRDTVPMRSKAQRPDQLPGGEMSNAYRQIYSCTNTQLQLRGMRSQPPPHWRTQAGAKELQQLRSLTHFPPTIVQLLHVFKRKSMFSTGNFR